MPVTLRRHLATVKNKEGKRVVPFGGKRDGLRAGTRLKSWQDMDWPKSITLGRIKSYSTEAERGILGAKTAQRAYGVKRGKVGLRKEIGWAGFFIDEKKSNGYC